MDLGGILFAGLELALKIIGNVILGFIHHQQTPKLSYMLQQMLLLPA